MSLADRIIEENFSRARGELCIGGAALSELAAAYGTPFYVYDAAIMRRDYARLSKAVAGFAEVFYSIKANPNPSVAGVFAEAGAGLEIASAAEFKVGRAAGSAPRRMIFAGPGKGEDELAFTLESGIGEIHLETFEEIEAVSRIARGLGRKAPVAIRVNPVSEARGGAMQMGGRPSQFGFDEEILDEIVACVCADPSLEFSGLHFFAGTQILDAELLLRQWGHAIGVARRVARAIERPLRTIDLGGGLGVPYYEGDAFLDLTAVAQGAPALRATLEREPLLRHAKVILEPGRFLTAGAGAYVMQVRAVKVSRGQRFIITDGGMHHHLAASGNLGQVIKRDYPIVPARCAAESAYAPCAIVGPLCTPLDTLGRSTAMPDLKRGDLIAVLQSGAYGLSASPVGFLSHPMPAEIMVEDGAHRLIRKPAC